LLQKACESLMARLQPYIAANPKGEWKDWVSAAYHDRVSLSATGFYKSVLSHSFATSTKYYCCVAQIFLENNNYYYGCYTLE